MTSKTINKWFRIPDSLCGEELLQRLDVALARLAYGKSPVNKVSITGVERTKVKVEFNREMEVHMSVLMTRHNLTQNDAVNSALFEICSNHSLYGVEINETTI
uniref:Uncharacterized protein n=1 Tax=Vibrio sp. FF_291 TaxID=1652832 RepID=A0A0H3ZVT3_9VIBR|nr:hypothetical protein [Vibrio sp. FF_291]